MKKNFYILFLAIAWTFTLYAQESKQVEEMGIEELLNVPVTVATMTQSTSRETPGIVSVISREEIRASGARDFIDLLRLVPGFEFGLDGWVPTGPSIRGLWGSEGRILLLWDGIPLNENSAGGLHIGNRFPVDQIKRIEIIRGPGSVIYGGTAELAVISVTSLDAEDIDGAGGGATYGQGTRDYLHRQGHAVFGKNWGATKLTAGLFAGDGQRTDQDNYFSSTGQPLNHKSNWNLKPFFFNLGLTVGGLQARFIHDKYQWSQAVNYGDTNLNTPQKQHFGNTVLEIKYESKPFEDWTFTPYLSRQWQKPWWVDVSESAISNMKMTRDRGGLMVNWTPTSMWSAILGFELMRDAAEKVDGGTFRRDGATTAAYTNQAYYGQVQFNGLINATAGTRVEHHSSYGTFAVPRFALTKLVNDWHFKALYAWSFRAPGISNIDIGVDPSAIKPEKTQTVEFEVGRKLGHGLLSANFFDTRIKEPLIYIGGTPDYYQNQSDTGSRGTEVEYKHREHWGFLNSSLSLYWASHGAIRYQAPGHSDISLAAPQVKVTTAGGWKIADHWTLGPSLIYLGRRYGLAWIPERNASDYKFFKPAVLLNLNAEYTVGHWTGSLAVMDILDQNPGYLQQYTGGQPHVPGSSREVVLKLRYGF